MEVPGRCHGFRDKERRMEYRALDRSRIDDADVPVDDERQTRP